MPEKKSFFVLVNFQGREKMDESEKAYSLYSLKNVANHCEWLHTINYRLESMNYFNISYLLKP